MAPIARPVFYEGQVLTAKDLNSISAYCASETKRLRIFCLLATLLSWAAAIAVLAARMTTPN